MRRGGGVKGFFLFETRTGAADKDYQLPFRVNGNVATLTVQLKD